MKVRELPLPETVTNGWMRLKVADDRCYAYYVPTGCVGRLTSSGAVLGRCDLLEHLKWTINGRETNIESDDCILLRTFFSGQRKIPGRSTNAALLSDKTSLYTPEMLRYEKIDRMAMSVNQYYHQPPLAR